MTGTKNGSAVRLYFAVMDVHGQHTRASSRTDAIRTARKWNKDYPALAPHRAIEVIAAEIK